MNFPQPITAIKPFKMAGESLKGFCTISELKEWIVIDDFVMGDPIAGAIKSDKSGKDAMAVGPIEFSLCHIPPPGKSVNWNVFKINFRDAVLKNGKIPGDITIRTCINQDNKAFPLAEYTFEDAMILHRGGDSYMLCFEEVLESIGHVSDDNVKKGGTKHKYVCTVTPSHYTNMNPHIK